MSSPSHVAAAPLPGTAGNDPPARGKSRDLFRYVTGCDAVLLTLALSLHFGVGGGMITMLLFFESFFGTAGDVQAIGGPIDMDVVNQTVRFMFFLGIGIGLFMFFANWPVAVVAANQKAAWKKASVLAILRQDVGWYDVSKPEQLASKMAEAVTSIHKAFDIQSAMAVQGLGMAVGGFTIGFTRAWNVALVVLCVLPVLIILISLFFVVLVGGAKLKTKAYAQAGGLANEALFSMRTVASLGLEETFATRYIGMLEAPMRIGILVSPLVGFMGSIAAVGLLLLLVAGFIAGGVFLADELDASSYEYTLSMQLPVDPADPTLGMQSVAVTYCAHANNTPAAEIATNGNACPAGLVPWQMNCLMMGFAGSMGDVVLFNNLTLLQTLGQPDLASFESYALANAPAEYLSSQPDPMSGCVLSGAVIIIAVFALMQGGQGFGTLMGALDPLSKGLVGAGTLSEVVRRTSPIDGFSTDGATPTSVSGDVAVQDVVFAYPSAPDHLVCKGYSLNIAAGQTVALCGPSGSGKSTIIALIERFYDPLSGVVTLDGVDIKTLNVKWLRAQLGLVGQEPVLFSGSVADNIGYGKLGASREEIEEAATMANAHSFITTNLANGYETDVGQGGGKLSGGQKQRVAIARAIIKKPAVLLLDEATSALDNESERVVQAALDEIMTKQKRTTIVIAHRLSTIRNADKIAVINEGRVVEEGRHAELLENVDGIYFNLVLAQSGDQKSSK